MTDLTVKIKKEIHAPIEQVFDAWLDSEMLTKFMMPMPNMEFPEVQCDSKQGGEFEILMKVGESAIPHTGKYVILDRPNKLAFTWVSPASPEDSVVTLDFFRISESVTKVELTQVNFIDEQHRSNHEGGWGNILSNLSALMS